MDKFRKCFSLHWAAYYGKEMAPKKPEILRSCLETFVFAEGIEQMYGYHNDCTIGARKWTSFIPKDG